MKILLITVAGSSTRFSESLGRPCLKCLYHEGGVERSLLHRMVHMGRDCDRIIIVGGFDYDNLKKNIESHYSDLFEKIVLVENKKFSEYGSGYSLYVGIKKALEQEFSELIFAEGDLWVDQTEFNSVLDSPMDVITYNHEPIRSDKAVIYYLNDDSKIRYHYDTNHKSIEIKEPFTAIYNSGQIWKFTDGRRVADVIENMDEADWKGTNLTFIQKYFGDMSPEMVKFIGFTKWVNCNTVSDYKMTQRWVCE